MEHNNYQDQMQHPNYSQELRAILRSHTTPKAFQDQLSDYHESDIADALEQLTADERKLVYQMLDADTLSEVLPYVDTPSHFLDELSLRKRVDVLTRMDADLTAVGAAYTGLPLTIDGNIITGEALGAAIPFALAIARELAGPDAAARVKKAIVYQ